MSKNKSRSLRHLNNEIVERSEFDNWENENDRNFNKVRAVEGGGASICNKECDSYIKKTGKCNTMGIPAPVGRECAPLKISREIGR